MTLKERWWRLRYLMTLLRAGGWRDLRTCRYLARCAELDGDPVDAAKEEMGYMAQDMG